MSSELNTGMVLITSALRVEPQAPYAVLGSLALAGQAVLARLAQGTCGSTEYHRICRTTH